jgi:hypothetical protein
MRHKMAIAIVAGQERATIRLSQRAASEALLERIVSGRTKQHELHTLPPWNWTASTSVSITNPAAQSPG